MLAKENTSAVDLTDSFFCNLGRYRVGVLRYSVSCLPCLKSFGVQLANGDEKCASVTRR